MRLSRLKIVKMSLFVIQCFLFVSAFLSVYGTFTSWKQPAPVTSYKLQPLVHDPIYDENGRVISGDFFKGDLKYVYAGVSHSDFSFVYYYAPWDKECQYFASEFWKLAHKFSKVAYFSAVNCWYAKGECRHAFPRTSKFPQIIAYIRGYHGSTYLGQLLFQDVEEFIISHMKPVRTVTSISDIIGYSLKYQAVIVGYYQVTEFGSTLYDRFANAARRAFYLSKENNWIFLSLVSSGPADEIGLRVNDIALITWNSTSYLPHNGTYTSDTILQWLRKDFKSVAIAYQSGLTDSSIVEHMLGTGIGVFVILPMQLKSESLSATRAEPRTFETNTEQDGDCVVSLNITNAVCKKKVLQFVLRTSEVLKVVETQIDTKVQQLIGLAVEEKLTERNPSFVPYWTQLSQVYSEMDISKIKINNQSVFFMLTDSRFPLLDNCGIQLKDDVANLVVIDQNNEILSLKENAQPQDIPLLFMNHTLVNTICSTDSYFQREQTSPNIPLLLLPDISSSDFENLVVDNQEDVLLFYNSITCGLCIGVSHVIISVAHMVRLVSKIRVYRIDGAYNTLPWQYTVPSYPTLVLFPGHNKADSVMFPHDEPVTVPNVITFLANNISPESRLELSLLHCNDQSSHCVNDVRLKLKLRIQKLRLLLNKLDSTVTSNSTAAKSNMFERNRNVISDELNYLSLMNFGLWTKLNSYAVAV